LFIQEPSKNLRCLLCQRIMKEPVVASCGHTFCKRCIETSVLGNERCPSDNNTLCAVAANLAVSEQIGELVVHCSYGCRQDSQTGCLVVDEEGCPATVKLKEKKNHENSCRYAPVQCPNSKICPKLLRMDLENHLSTCQFCSCPNKRYGCNFEGKLAELDEHLEVCRYQDFKEYFEDVDDKVHELQQIIKKKDQDISYLHSVLLNISERLLKLEKTVDIRFEVISDNQTKLADDITGSVRAINQISNEMVDLQARIGAAGNFEVQTMFKCQGTFVGHQGPVWALGVHADFLFSASSDKTIKVWDTKNSYKCIRTLTGHKNIVLGLCVHGTNLFSGSSDNTIKVWEISTLEMLKTISAHDNPVCTLATSSDWLFSGSHKIIKVWDIKTFKHYHDLTGLNHWVRALVCKDDKLYSGSYQNIKIWDLNTFDCSYVLQTSGGSIYSLAVTESYIICGTYENNIHVWDVLSYEQQKTLAGHTGTIYALAVIDTPSQPKLFSASNDKTLRVWRLGSFDCVQTMARHDGSVACLVVSNNRVFSGALDNTIKVSFLFLSMSIGTA
ncbi:uncharacterized protein TRIADDRAFT_19665, partial [Trichoplax adhaerens]